MQIFYSFAIKVSNKTWKITFSIQAFDFFMIVGKMMCVDERFFRCKNKEFILDQANFWN